MDRGQNSAEKIREEVFSRWIAPAAARIVETLNNGRSPLAGLGAPGATPPVFAARLTMLARLALGDAQRIDKVAQATNALGIANMKPLILAQLAYETKTLGTEQASDRSTATLRELWEHALGSAMMAARIAGKLEAVSPQGAFVAGYIHDIGRALLLRYSRSDFATALSMSQQLRLPIRYSENRVIGIDHVAMGDAWCHKCEIAQPLAEVVRHHHETLADLEGPVGHEVSQMIAVVQAAESLIGQEPNLAGEGLAEGADSWSLLGLNRGDWQEPWQSVKAEIAGLHEAFGFYHFAAQPFRLYRRPLAADAVELPTAAKYAVDGSGQVIPFPRSAANAARLDGHAPAHQLVLLIVDDHGSLCDMVSLFLMRQGYQVRTANNGALALEILAREEIHLMLLDLMVPQVDGFEVLHQVQQSRPELLPYIIAVSAGASQADRRKIFDLGANEYMAKPFHLARLLERVHAVEQYLL